MLIRDLTNDLTSSEHLFNLQADLIAQIRQAYANCRDHSNWKLSSGATTLLEKVGIMCNPHPIYTHGHPACRTIESYILNVVIPPLFKEEFTTFWSKDYKSQELTNKVGHRNHVINLPIAPKDFTRYTTYMDTIPEITTKGAFIFDSAHYLNPRDIHEIFNRSPTLEYIIATVVLPPELLDDQPPLFHDIYTFKKLDSQTFEFYPDDHVAGAYSQDRKSVV